MRRALGLPAKARLSAEQWRRLQIERERQTTLAKIEREESEEHQERQRALHREQQKRWAKASREKIAESQRKWKEKNPDYHRRANDRYECDPESRRRRAGPTTRRTATGLTQRAGRAGPLNELGTRAASGYVFIGRRPARTLQWILWAPKWKVSANSANS
ncbi:MAG: hypothetical protein AB7T59_15185 [Hyphomonadaceae bacterium]